MVSHRWGKNIYNTCLTKKAFEVYKFLLKQ